MVFDGKADTRLTSLDTAAATPEEGVSAANLSELAFVGEAGFAEGCNVNSVAQALWLLGSEPPMCGFATTASRVSEPAASPLPHRHRT